MSQLAPSEHTRPANRRKMAPQQGWEAERPAGRYQLMHSKYFIFQNNLPVDSHFHL